VASRGAAGTAAAPDDEKDDGDIHGQSSGCANFARDVVMFGRVIRLQGNWLKKSQAVAARDRPGGRVGGMASACCRFLSPFPTPAATAPRDSAKPKFLLSAARLE
jgi:hypothetical protein